jgi:Flp pilus assembly protein TadG
MISDRLAQINFSCLRSFCKNERGNVFLALALTFPLLIGGFGLGAEVAYWRVLHRGMQDAADSAALAAAANNGATYTGEAKSVTSQYGFADGVNQVSVAVSNPATAAGCTANCYVVTISKKVPLSLSQVIGFNGDTTVNGQKAVTIAATAVATTSGAGNTQYCILALATSGNAQAITTNGSPKADLFGCNVMSNTNATCNGHDLNATYGDAHKTSTGCGSTPRSGQPLVTDPYAYLAPNIPADNCNKNYPQEPAKKKDPALPASNKLSGTYSFPSTKVMCGDQQLVGNTTINNTTLVIENGQLDTNGFTLTGDNLTVIFSGSNGSYQHVPTGGGTLDITPPTTGDWKGMAIYQDPALTTGVNVSAAGNSPTWNISGAIYLPHSSVTFSGAVNKSSQGYRCFTMVIDNITVNGTADIFANDNQCNEAGLTMPIGGSRGRLVN